MILNNFSKEVIRIGGNFSNCCGSNFLGSEVKERKWKNQYGEGIILGKVVDPIKNNRYGICLADGFTGTAGAYLKGTINHIKTKNGNITIGIREKA